MKDKLLMIGSGSMGTSMAKVFHDANKVDVVIYGINPKQLKELKEGKNTKFFSEDIKIPKFETNSNIENALKGVKYVAIAVPSNIYDIVLDNLLKHLKHKIIILNLSKGFFPKTQVSIRQGIKDITKDNKFIIDVISVLGPSHAEEIIRGIPTAVVIVNENKELLMETQDIFQTSYFRTYIQTDVNGAEVGVAYKNIVAIATGISSGLGFGVNTIAAIITRSLIEIKKFNKVMGGKEETLMGLSGIGDLIVTATSELSRNFKFGKMLVEDQKTALSTKGTVEGFNALEIIYNIGKKNNLDLPIVQYLYDVIHNDLDPHNIIESIFKRKLKSE